MTAQPRPDPVDRLLADLAGDVAETPPNRLRSAVLAAVRADQQAAPWPPADTLPGPARPLARQAQALDALLADLTAGGWGRPVLNDWSTAQVVGHLLAVDGLCAAALGLPVPPEAGGPVRPDDPLGWDVQRRTATVFDRAAGGPVRVRRGYLLDGAAAGFLTGGPAFFAAGLAAALGGGLAAALAGAARGARVFPAGAALLPFQVRRALRASATTLAMSSSV